MSFGLHCFKVVEVQHERTCSAAWLFKTRFGVWVFYIITGVLQLVGLMSLIHRWGMLVTVGNTSWVRIFDTLLRPKPWKGVQIVQHERNSPTWLFQRPLFLGMRMVIGWVGVTWTTGL